MVAGVAGLTVRGVGEGFGGFGGFEVMEMMVLVLMGWEEG